MLICAKWQRQVKADFLWKTKRYITTNEEMIAKRGRAAGITTGVVSKWGEGE